MQSPQELAFNLLKMLMTMRYERGEANVNPSPQLPPNWGLRPGLRGAICQIKDMKHLLNKIYSIYKKKL